jgi:hypothetical protein
MSRRWLSGLLAGAVVVCSSATRADEPKTLPPTVEKVLPPPTVEKVPPPRTELPPVLPPSAEVLPGAPHEAGPGWAAGPHTISRLKIAIVEEQNLATRDRIAIRDNVSVQVGPKVVVEYREERQTATEMVLKERVSEQVVTVNVLKEVKTVDPVTGKPCVTHEVCPETRVVKVKAYDLVPETREYIVRIPCPKTVDEVLLVKKLCAYPTTQAVIETRLHAESTHQELTVPVCPEALPPLPAPVAAPCENCHRK